MVHHDAQLATTMRGRITAVRGTVVDAWFENGLPPIDAALDCELDGTTVGDRRRPFASGQLVGAGDRDQQHARDATGGAW